MVALKPRSSRSSGMKLKPGAAPFAHAGPGDVTAVQDYRTGLNNRDTRRRFAEFGLSVAVDSGHAQDFAGGDRKTDVVERRRP